MNQEVLDRLIEAEGGYKYIQIKDDKGGRTFAGISHRSNPDWIGWAYLDSCKPNNPVPVDSIKKLKPLVKKLYDEKYWVKANLSSAVFTGKDYSELNDLKEMLFHISVLSGPRVAIYCLQNAIGVRPDGIWGERTMAALQSEISYFERQRDNGNYIANNDNLECIQRGVALNVINRFVRIVDNDSTQAKFLKGWIKRSLNLVG